MSYFPHYVTVIWCEWQLKLGMCLPSFQSQNLSGDFMWPLKWFTDFLMSIPNIPRYGSIMIAIFFLLFNTWQGQIPSADQNTQLSPSLLHFPVTFTCPVTLQGFQLQRKKESMQLCKGTWYPPCNMALAFAVIHSYELAI